MVKSLRETLEELWANHEYRMKTDGRYRISYEYFKAVMQNQEERSRHYDSQGYCDNPGRGY